jgi:hypothetical protein
MAPWAPRLRAKGGLVRGTLWDATWRVRLDLVRRPPTLHYKNRSPFVLLASEFGAANMSWEVV